MPADLLRIAFWADPNETHTRRWAGWFAARGHEVVLIVSPEVEVRPGLPDGIEVAVWPPYGGGPFKPFRYVAAARVMRRLVAEIGPDVTHAHYLSSYSWLAWLSGFRPYGVTTWGSDIYYDLTLGRRYTAFGRLALRGASFVTADSRDLLRATIAAGARPERTALVQWGVEVARFADAATDRLRTSLGLDGRRVVFSPRTIMPLYNHDVVLRALCRLPADVHLLMSARAAYPDELARIEGLIDELDLADRVTILPGIAYPDMAAHHRLADVVVSVPKTDGTPVTMWEAMAAGVPMVASDIPSLREWLADLTPDLLVPVGDVERTAGAIASVLEMPAPERQALGDRLRAFADERGDHDRNMAAMEELYRSAVRGRVEIPASIRPS
jgi:glycosyltransferase involved in cell wall biosynthesis